MVWPIPHPRNKTLPTGGVHNPIHRFRTITIPKWIGLTPNLIATGRKIGVNINTAGVMSIKVPTTNRIELMISRITIGFAETEIRDALKFWGIFS